MYLQTLSASIRRTYGAADDSSQDVLIFKDLKSFMTSLTVPQNTSSYPYNYTK